MIKTRFLEPGASMNEKNRTRVRIACEKIIDAVKILRDVSKHDFFLEKLLEFQMETLILDHYVESGFDYLECIAKTLKEKIEN